MTVYTLDGSELIATHYCPQGNAPRLKLTGKDQSGANHFLFMDGANLQAPSGSHAHSFWLRVENQNAISRSEAYIGNADKYDPAKLKEQVESFHRVK